jgi:trehalose 6-phosphate synthase
VSLAATLRATGGLWFGWSSRTAEEAGSVHRQTFGNVDYATVDLTPEEYAGYYHGYSNSVLWPLCHGLPCSPRTDAESYSSYERVNTRFAALLSPLLEASDLVWVHDYHLLLLGEQLRAAGCQQRLGFFLHVPCPPLQQLAEGRGLLEALLAYDLIGFQTDADLETFKQAAVWCWSIDAVAAEGSLLVAGRRVTLGVFPVGVDLAAITAAAQRMPSREVANWWPRGSGVLRLIGADRLDGSKGLPLRLQAYRQFLTAQAADMAAADYLQFITPSRSELPAQQALRAVVQAAAEEVNVAHPHHHGLALRCAFTAVEHATLMGLLASADVALVTPLRDGMNLLAKEFVAAQPAHDPGVLVLSAQAGAARELEGAVLVDPADVRCIANAIATAISMPSDERRERHRSMLAALQRNELSTWSGGFIGRLRENVQR